MRKNIILRVALLVCLLIIMASIVSVKKITDSFVSSISDMNFSNPKPFVYFNDEMINLSRGLNSLRKNSEMNIGSMSSEGFYTFTEDQALQLEKVMSFVPDDKESWEKLFSGKDEVLMATDGNYYTVVRIYGKQLSELSRKCFENGESERGLKLLRKAFVLSLALGRGMDGFALLINGMIDMSLHNYYFTGLEKILSSDTIEISELFRAGAADILIADRGEMFDLIDYAEGEKKISKFVVEKLEKEYPVSMFLTDYLVSFGNRTSDEISRISSEARKFLKNSAQMSESELYSADEQFQKLKGNNPIIGFCIPNYAKSVIKYRIMQTRRNLLIMALSGTAQPDPWSDGSLKITEINGKKVYYSVGPDKVDDQGKKVFKETGAGDIILSVR